LNPKLKFKPTATIRFMMVPRDEMEKDLKAQEKELVDDLTSLSKKVSSWNLCAMEC
jgi:hypothetical protein